MGNAQELRSHYFKMTKIKDEHESFCNCYQPNKTHYDSLTTDADKIEAAKKTLTKLIEQVDSENAEYIATELATKFGIDVSNL